MTDKDREVVIAGAGIAGCALAMLALKRGFGVRLLHRLTEERPTIEALDATATRALQAVGLGEVLDRAEPVRVRGLERHWETASALAGWYTHVDRAALARQAREEVATLGARLEIIEELPDVPTDVLAAVDATGRNAAWSQPIESRHPATLTYYEGPGFNIAMPARYVRLSEGWVYRIPHHSMTTVGLIHERGKGPPRLPDALAEVLGMQADDLERIGKASISVQWSGLPVFGNRLAIGDAALGQDPMATGGLGFAVSSAQAADAVIATWLTQPGNTPAQRYFTDFVGDARGRHLAMLDGVYHRSQGRPPVLKRELLVFAGVARKTGVCDGDAIVDGEAIVLPDGRLVRWIGSFDLLDLPPLCSQPRPVDRIVEGLVGTGLTAAQAASVVDWCTRCGVLIPVSSLIQDPRAARRAG